MGIEFIGLSSGCEGEFYFHNFPLDEEMSLSQRDYPF